MPKANDRYCWIKITDARASPDAVDVTGPAPAAGTGTPYRAVRSTDGRPPPIDPLTERVEGRPPPIAPRAHAILAGRPPPVAHVIKGTDPLPARWGWDDKTVHYDVPGEDPDVQMHVVDGDWAAARDWIASPQGVHWSNDAKALWLMSFKEAP